MLMILLAFTLPILVLILFLSLFFFASKNMSWDSLSSSVFECGFSSWFFSRFSFSIHYFLVALIFLFLDLELCLTLPLLNSFLESVEMLINFYLFIIILVAGLFLEWAEKKIIWVF